MNKRQPSPDIHYVNLSLVSFEVPNQTIDWDMFTFFPVVAATGEVDATRGVDVEPRYIWRFTWLTDDGWCMFQEIKEGIEPISFPDFYTYYEWGKEHGMFRKSMKNKKLDTTP